MGGCRQLSSGLEDFPPILGQEPLGNQRRLDAPQLCADFASDLRPLPSLCPLFLGQPTVLGLRSRDPSTSCLGPRSGRFASVTRAAPRFLHRRALARCTGFSSRTTALARPFWAKAGRRADLVAFFEPHVCPDMTIKNNIFWHAHREPSSKNRGPRSNCQGLRSEALEPNNP